MWNRPFAVGDCRGPELFVAGIIVHWRDSKPDYARVMGNPEVIPTVRPRTDREVTDRLNVQFVGEAMYRSNRPVSKSSCHLDCEGRFRLAKPALLKEGKP